jgi:hypothetical protein
LSACLLIYQPLCSAPSPSPPADIYPTPALVTYRAWRIDPPCNVAGPDLGDAIGSSPSAFVSYHAWQVQDGVRKPSSCGVRAL